MDKIIFKVNAGTATTPTYFIIAMEFSLLNIDFFAEIQPIRINIATGAKEFISKLINEFSHQISEAFI